MRLTALAALSLAVLGPSGITQAQSPGQQPSPDRPKRVSDLRLQALPAIGGTLLDTEGNQPADESEYALSLRLIRPLFLKYEILAEPVAAYSPRTYDERSPASQLRTTLEIRRRFEIEEADEDGVLNRDRATVQPFARWSPSIGFDRAFGTRRFFDNALQIGARFAQPIWFECRRSVFVGAGLCRKDRKFSFELSPSLQHVLSDDRERRRLTPVVEGTGSIPFRNIDVKLTSRFENRRFTHLRLPDGRLQRDGRVSADLALDFAPFIKCFQYRRWGNRDIYNDFSVQIGARYIRNRSNNVSDNFQRVFAIAGVVYTRRLSAPERSSRQPACS